MSMDIKDLALQPPMQVWHPTCITSSQRLRRQRDSQTPGFEIFRCALRQRMPAKRPALAHVVCFRGRN